jgi:hypothetical protein
VLPFAVRFDTQAQAVDEVNDRTSDLVLLRRCALVMLIDESVDNAGYMSQEWVAQAKPLRMPFYGTHIRLAKVRFKGRIVLALHIVHVVLI